MGKSSRKYRQKASLMTTTTKSTTPTNNGDSNNYYESFPIVRRLSRSRSRSRSRTPSTGQTTVESEGGGSSKNPKLLPSTLSHEKSKAIGPTESLEDPGNPLGNAVDFCVSNIQTLHTKSINALQSSKSIDVTSVLKSCHGTSYESILDEIFLCNNLICKPNASNLTNKQNASTAQDIVTEGEEDPLQAISENKKEGKQRWKKKTLMIMSGKKFLRSMSLKRKKSLSPRASTSLDPIADASPSADVGADPVVETKPDDDDEQSLIWKGIEDEQNPLTEGATVISRESDEDTLFTNLDNVDSWNTTPVDDQDKIILLPDAHAKVKTADSERGSFGDEGPSEHDTTFHLLFSPVSLCNLSTTLPEGAVDPDAIPLKGDLVYPRDFETDAVIDSKQQDTIVSTKTAKPTRPPKISIVGTDLKRTLCQDNEEEAKVEFEMILDDSRFGHRNWGKIIPWKKLGSILSSSTYHSNSRSNCSSENSSRGSGRSLYGSIMSTTSKRTPQDSTAKTKAEEEKDLTQRDITYTEEEEAKESALVLDDLSISRNVNEPRSSPTPSIASSQQSAEVLRKRRLQSVLKGFSSSRKNGLNRTSSTISKQRRASWKKMLVVTVPSGQKLPQQQEHQLYQSSPQSNPSEISSSQEEGYNSNLPTHQANEEEETSTGSDHVQYIESDEEKKEKEPENSMTCTVKDQSSTDVMGLHDWSWGVFNMDLKDDEDFHDSDIDPDIDLDKEDANQLILGGVAIPFLGVIDGLDHEEDERTEFSLQTEACCQNGDLSYAYGEEELRYYDGTNHDDWIMDEDQLVSFEDDSTRKTIDSCISTNEDFIETFEDYDDEDTIVSKKVNEMDVSSSSLSPHESLRNRLVKATNNHSVMQMQNRNQPSRRGFVAVQKSARSKSIFKTFSPLKRKKKNKGAINITNDVSVNAEVIGNDVTDAEDGACIIETVLIDPNSKSKLKSIANSITKPIKKPVKKTKGKNQKGSTSIAVAAAAVSAVKPTSETKRKNQKDTSSVVVAAAAAAATAAVVSKVKPSTEDQRDDLSDDRSQRHSNINVNSRSRSFQSNFSLSSAATKKGNQKKKLWVGKQVAQEGKSTASVASMSTATSTNKKGNHTRKLLVDNQAIQGGKSTASVASISTATSGSQRKWSNLMLTKSISRTSSKASQMSSMKDIITVVSKRSSISEDAAAAAAVAARIRNTRSNDYLGRYATLLEGESTSASSNSSSSSSSWARDDKNRYYYGSPQDVIRE